MRLENSRVVVVGGSSGIGLATAKLAAAEGARVVIASRSKERLEAAAKEVGRSAEAHVLDAMDERSVKEFFGKLGEIDHLATPGSDTVLGSFRDLDLPNARRGFDLKYWPQYLAAKHAVARLREGGSMTFMAGSFSRRPQAMGTLQASINSAIEGLGRALAVELGPLRVNTVSPGMVDTPMWDDMPDDQREKMYASTADRLPSGRIATAEDVAQAFVFLMANPQMTGTTLFVDGGDTLY